MTLFPSIAVLWAKDVAHLLLGAVGLAEADPELVLRCRRPLCAAPHLLDLQPLAGIRNVGEAPSDRRREGELEGDGNGRILAAPEGILPANPRRLFGVG